jgi:hypothetical protein
VNHMEALAQITCGPPVVIAIAITRAATRRLVVVIDDRDIPATTLMRPAEAAETVAYAPRLFGERLRERLSRPGWQAVEPPAGA